MDKARGENFIKRFLKRSILLRRAGSQARNTETALDGAALRNTSRFSSAGLRTHDPDDSAFPGMIPVAVGVAAREGGHSPLRGQCRDGSRKERHRLPV